MVNLDYFYGSEGEQYRFYQIPAILLEDEEYKKISDTAKLLYGRYFFKAVKIVYKLT